MGGVIKMTDKMMRMAGRDKDGLAKAIKTDTEGNIGVQVSSAEVAIPVDLQYHDLAVPIPVESNNKLRMIKDFRALMGSGTSFFIGNKATQKSAEIEALDVSNFKHISISVKNDSAKNLHFRGVFFTLSSDTHENDAVTYLSQLDWTINSESRMQVSEYGYATTDTALVTNEKIKVLENPPFPYLFFQIRSVEGTGVGPIDVEIYGVRK